MMIPSKGETGSLVRFMSKSNAAPATVSLTTLFAHHWNFWEGKDKGG